MPSSIADTLRVLLADDSDVGLARMVEALKASPESRAAWTRLREDGALANLAIPAIERSGALKQAIEPRPRVLVQDLLTILRKAGPGGPGFELLVSAWNSAPQHEVRLCAAHALNGRAEPRGLDAVIARFDDVKGNERYAALYALFTRDPITAFDELAPRFATPSEEAGEFLEETLNALMRDITDDGKAHWGASRGWFAADPRWRALCGEWRTLPENRDAWGAKRAQEIVEVAGWLRKRK